MNKKKVITRIVLVCLAISMISHWRDLKKGFVDGFNDGYNTMSGK